MPVPDVDGLSPGTELCCCVMKEEPAGEPLEVAPRGPRPLTGAVWGRLSMSPMGDAGGTAMGSSRWDLCGAAAAATGFTVVLFLRATRAFLPPAQAYRAE